MNDLMFSEYATKFSKNAIALRGSLSEAQRIAVGDIIDILAEDPSGRQGSILLLDDIFVYKDQKQSLEVTYKLDKDKKIIYILHIAAPQLQVSKSLFISYSHKDKEWLDELRKWLRPLEQSDIIKVWDDGMIKSGDDWREKIKEALSSAKAAVLLISQDFLVSEFIRDNELPKLLDAAENDGLKIFWIAVKESTVDDTPIVKYQAVQKDPLEHLAPAERNKSFHEIYRKIKEVVKV